MKKHPHWDNAVGWRRWHLENDSKGDVGFFTPAVLQELADGPILSPVRIFLPCVRMSR